MPPAVLTITASRSAAAGPGKRTRSEPASPTCRRRVTPRAAATDSATSARGRLAEKVWAALAKTDTAIASSENLERQHALECRLVHAVAGARIHDGAALHHSEMVAEFARKVEILLDQQDGDVAQVAQVGDGAGNVLDDRRLNALGGLVEQQQPRPHDQGAAYGELLLLAAGEVAAAPAEHVVQDGKQREHVVGDGAVQAPEWREPGLEILLHGEQRKNLAALRHVGDAAAGPLVGFQAGNVRFVEMNGPAAHMMVAGQRAQQAGLAHAVAAEHAGHLAGLGAKLDAAQRLRGAVVEIDSSHVEHCGSSGMPIMRLSSRPSAPGQVRGRLRRESRDPSTPAVTFS